MSLLPRAGHSSPSGKWCWVQKGRQEAALHLVLLQGPSSGLHFPKWSRAHFSHLPNCICGSPFWALSTLLVTSASDWTAHGEGLLGGRDLGQLPDSSRVTYGIKLDSVALKSLGNAELLASFEKQSTYTCYFSSTFSHKIILDLLLLNLFIFKMLIK